MARSNDASRSPVALVTGGSRGLGRALSLTLIADGWTVITDGRDPAALAATVETAAARGADGKVVAVAGDVADATHRERLAAAVRDAGRLDVLVNNASTLGPSPRPPLAGYPGDALQRVFAVNAVAPLLLAQLVLGDLRRSGGCMVNVSSDAAAEAYDGWGGYGASKAALDHLSAVLAVENPDLRIYAFDPGDMATDMQQEAFPGEDISDRASPDSVVPAIRALLEGRRPSGRYRAADLAEAPGR